MRIRNVKIFALLQNITMYFWYISKRDKVSLFLGTLIKSITQGKLEEKTQGFGKTINANGRKIGRKKAEINCLSVSVT